jgi:hypothetical protein
MTIQVELDPETEARLAAQAARRGIPPEQYALEFLRENLPRCGTGTGILTSDRVDELSMRLSEGTEHIPVLLDEVNKRSTYYEERW